MPRLGRQPIGRRTIGSALQRLRVAQPGTAFPIRPLNIVGPPNPGGSYDAFVKAEIRRWPPLLAKVGLRPQ